MIILLLALFFCFPFLTLIFAIKRIRQWQYRTVILLFFLLGAYLLIPYQLGDIRLYEVQMERYSSYGFFQFLAEMSLNLIGKGEVGFEIFVQLNTFLVSRFTDNVAYCYCLTALVVFMVWQAMVMQLVREYDEQNPVSKNKVATFLLIFFGLYIIYFRAINGRFYIAYWVFIYAFYKIVAQRKFNYHWLLLMTIFIHQSFIFLNVLVIVYRLMEPLQKIKRFEIVLFALIIAGTAFAQTGLGLMNEYLSSVGGDFEHRYSVYTTTHYVEQQVSRDRKWFLELRTPLLFYSLVASIIAARMNSKIVFDKATMRLYYFSLLLWVINAFTINVPSFGERFRNVLMGVFLLVLFKVYSSNNVHRAYPVTIVVLSFTFIMYKAISIKILGGYINLWLFEPFSLLMNNYSGPVPLDPS